MATGGTLWFPDLMAVDSTFFLPVISCMSWLAVCEVSAWCISKVLAEPTPCFSDGRRANVLQ